VEFTMPRNCVDLVTRRYLIVGLAPWKLRRGGGRRERRLKVTTSPSTLLWLTGLLAFTSMAAAQNPIPTDLPDASSIHGVRRTPTRAATDDGSGLPIWHYQVISPLNGASYTGYMVGTDPFPARRTDDHHPGNPCPVCRAVHKHRVGIYHDV